jgi:death-on-curing protein
VHVETLKAHGGASGVADMGVLQSALAMPQMGIGEEYFHTTLWEMAAAYAFHICQNHPFVDGNKRTALIAALTFLYLNGIRLRDPEGELYEAMISVASGKASKASLAVLFEQLAKGK